MLPSLNKPIFGALILVLTITTTTAFAAEPPALQAALLNLARQWAHVTYQMKDEGQQATRMKGLATEAAGIAARYPNRAEPLIWSGVIASSQAKYAGPFSALGYARQARKLLEKAARLDYRALDGAVPTSLGALYYLVPGFPFGFGDNDKARQYLEQAVEISPNGLDSNYFYGDFLFHQGHYARAVVVLKRALKSPVDGQRPVWDAGRRAEIRRLLASVDGKLASNR